VEQARPLRRGWTTGTCATAAAKAAYAALLGGVFPDPVEVTLPRGERVAFALAETSFDALSASAGVVKDAGDDPDVTHGALIRATVSYAAPGAGVTFRAGPGVGTVTRPGLPLPPGEPAINPVPREMIRAAIAEVARAHGAAGDVVVEISVPDGEALALRTLNGRLGIVGGLSILGTTGIVVPYSCAAWIDSIHRGIDVARAMGLDHVAAATGSTSEAAVQALHGLPEVALLDMGDFVGGTLKYLRHHPVRRVTIAGGVAKMTKLAQGRLDLHSKRGAADFSALAALAHGCGASGAAVARIATANTVAEAFALADVPLGDAIAAAAWNVAAPVLMPADSELEIVVFDRDKNLVGRAGFAAVHGAPLNRRR
jgi:cobalt-precorrin-5B (C1)-methyltransferase